jgi:hypothetical protein
VTTKDVDLSPSSLPSFSPMVPPAAEDEVLRPRDTTAWSKAYQSLTTPEKNALIMDARRKWYEALVERYPAPDFKEEEQTSKVEAEANKAK